MMDFVILIGYIIVYFDVLEVDKNGKMLDYLEKDWENKFGF